MTSLTPTQFYALFFGMSAFFGAGLSLLAYITYRIIDLGRRWVIEIPGTPRALASIKRRRLKRGATYQRPGLQKGDKEVVIADPDAIYPTIRGPLHLVHKDTGYSLIAPGSNDVPPSLVSETEKSLAGLTDPAELTKVKLENEAIKARNADKLLSWIRMTVSGPLLYWKAIRTNDWQDWLDTQTGKPDWRVQIFPLLLLGVMIVLVAFCWLAWQLLKRGSTGG